MFNMEKRYRNKIIITIIIIIIIMVSLQTITYANISSKMVNPRDIAGNAEEEEVLSLEVGNKLASLPDACCYKAVLGLVGPVLVYCDWANFPLNVAAREFFWADPLLEPPRWPSG